MLISINTKFAFYELSQENTICSLCLFYHLHFLQRLAADFLKNYIFLTVGKVGSSTDLIAQKVEFVRDMDKIQHLCGLLKNQRDNGTHGKV